MRSWPACRTPPIWRVKWASPTNSSHRSPSRRRSGTTASIASPTVCSSGCRDGSPRWRRRDCFPGVGSCAPRSNRCCLARRSTTTRSATWCEARFGDEVHERLVDALVGSIYATDTDRFSLREVPQLYDLASQERSLLLGARRRAGAGAATAVGRTDLRHASRRDLAAGRRDRGRHRRCRWGGANGGRGRIDPARRCTRCGVAGRRTSGSTP